MSLLQFPASTYDENLLDNLKAELDKICEEIAAQYNLVDRNGRAKKALIIDALVNNPCLSCALKELLHTSNDEVDALYRENHSLALNILVEALRYRLSLEGLSAIVEGELPGEYGRVDVLIKIVRQGVLIRLRDLVIIVELKTGLSMSLTQLFRYALEYSHSLIVVWRVRVRQLFTLDMAKHGRILLAYIFTIVNRGRALLDGKFMECKHGGDKGTRNSRIEDPQQVLDEFLEALADTLPEATAKIVQLIKEKMIAGGEQVGF